jgi:hypothetical protein
LTPNRSLIGGFPTSRRTSTAWISFFALDRERTSCSRRDRRRRITRQRSSGVRTASSSPAHSSFANARASNRSVFARAPAIPVSAGLTTRTFATCGSRIRAISHAQPSPPTRPYPSATDSPQASSTPRASSRPDPPSGPPPRPRRKSRCTSNPIALTSTSSTQTDTCSRQS